MRQMFNQRLSSWLNFTPSLQSLLPTPRPQPARTGHDRHEAAPAPQRSLRHPPPAPHTQVCEALKENPAMAKYFRQTPTPWQGHPHRQGGQGRRYSDRPACSARCVSHCGPAPEGHGKGALKPAHVTAPPVAQMEILQQMDSQRSWEDNREE